MLLCAPGIAQLTRRVCLDRLAAGSREEPAGRTIGEALGMPSGTIASRIRAV